MGSCKAVSLNCWREHELENNDPVMVGAKGPVWRIYSLGIGYLVWGLLKSVDQHVRYQVKVSVGVWKGADGRLSKQPGPIIV